MSRWTAAAALACAVAVMAVGCGESGDRRDARRTLVAQLVDAGLPADLADCVVEGFFDVRSDAELRAFYERDSLTDDEVEEFARLAELCGG